MKILLPPGAGCCAATALNIYAVAQLNMGIAYCNNGSLDEAVTAWNRVLEEDDPQSYAEAQRNLALVNKH